MKFFKLYPFRTLQSKEAIECLRLFFHNYSRPNKIVLDLGLDTDVVHAKVATHSPRSNGQVERLNRILIPMLAKECYPDKYSGWAKRLAMIVFGIVNRSTGFGRSVLLIGKCQKGKLSKII